MDHSMQWCVNIFEALNIAIKLREGTLRRPTKHPEDLDPIVLQDVYLLPNDFKLWVIVWVIVQRNMSCRMIFVVDMDCGYDDMSNSSIVLQHWKDRNVLAMIEVCLIVVNDPRHLFLRHFNFHHGLGC
jgi:hypothetical protein